MYEYMDTHTIHFYYMNDVIRESGTRAFIPLENGDIEAFNANLDVAKQVPGYDYNIEEVDEIDEEVFSELPEDVEYYMNHSDELTQLYSGGFDFMQFIDEHKYYTDGEDEWPEYNDLTTLYGDLMGNNKFWSDLYGIAETEYSSNF